MTHNSAQDHSVHSPMRRGRRPAGILAGTGVFILAAAMAWQSPAYGAEAPVGLGTAAPYSVLAGTTATNTGPSVLGGSLGVSPGDAITGFPPGLVGGAVHAGDAAALQAQSDLTIAYDDAAGRALTASVAGDLVGQTLLPGVYKSTGPLEVSGALTLNGQGNPKSVFIFQVASTLITASASRIVLTNSTQACNVYWQVGSSATLGTASTFKGTIMALTSISVTTGATVEGRALARNGQVSLDTNVFTMPGCDTTTPTTTATATPTDTTSATPTTTVSGSAPSVPAAGTGAGTGNGGNGGGTGNGGDTGAGAGNGNGADSGAGAGNGGRPLADTGGQPGMNHGANVDTAAAAPSGWEIAGVVAVVAGVAAGAGIAARARLLGRRRSS